MFTEEMQNPSAHCFVIQMNGILRDQTVGFICFQNIENESEILNICVHPRFRQLGIGKQLMQFYIDFCRKIKTFFLEVSASNQPAIHLYRLFSYQTVGIRKRFYQGTLDALLM